MDSYTINFVFCIFIKCAFGFIYIQGTRYAYIDTHVCTADNAWTLSTITTLYRNLVESTTIGHVRTVTHLLRLHVLVHKLSTPTERMSVHNIPRRLHLTTKCTRITLRKKAYITVVDTPYSEFHDQHDVTSTVTLHIHSPTSITVKIQLVVCQWFYEGMG